MRTVSHRRPLLAAGLTLTLALTTAALVTAGPAPADNKDKAASPA
jgi:hypothetical protein